LLDDSNLGVCLFGRDGSSTSRRSNRDDGFFLGFGESNRRRAERPEWLPVGEYDFIATTASRLPSFASVSPFVALEFFLRVKVELRRVGRDLVQSASGGIDGRQEGKTEFFVLDLAAIRGVTNEVEGLLVDLDLFSNAMGDGSPMIEMSGGIAKVLEVVTHLNSPPSPRSLQYRSANCSGTLNASRMSHSN